MSKSVHFAYLADLARRGFVVATVDYRLGHEAPFPGAVLDVKAAIRYLRAHAKRYHINPEKIGVSGESAGGYLSAMVALTKKDAFPSGEFESNCHPEYSSDVQAACAWYLPCDMKRLMRETFRMQFQFFAGNLDDEQYCRYINPTTYITPKAPPFLIFHADNDVVVPPLHGDLFYEALVANNVDAQMVIVEGGGHGGPRFYQRCIWDMVAKFFTEKLK